MPWRPFWQAFSCGLGNIPNFKDIFFAVYANGVAIQFDPWTSFAGRRRSSRNRPARCCLGGRRLRRWLLLAGRSLRQRLKLEGRQRLRRWPELRAIGHVGQVRIAGWLQLRTLVSDETTFEIPQQQLRHAAKRPPSKKKTRPCFEPQTLAMEIHARHVFRTLCLPTTTINLN